MFPDDVVERAIVNEQLAIINDWRVINTLLAFNRFWCVIRRYP